MRKLEAEEAGGVGTFLICLGQVGWRARWELFWTWNVARWGLLGGRREVLHQESCRLLVWLWLLRFFVFGSFLHQALWRGHLVWLGFLLATRSSRGEPSNCALRNLVGQLLPRVHPLGGGGGLLGLIAGAGPVLGDVDGGGDLLLPRLVAVWLLAVVRAAKPANLNLKKVSGKKLLSSF